MNPNAVVQAKQRLARAREAIDALRIGKDKPRAWADFLSATNSIYSKLEQGAKTNGKSSAWFGRVKRIRKSDQLLCYLHHARNAEEHGLIGSLGLGRPKLEKIALDAEVAKGEAKIIVRDRKNRPAAALKASVGKSKLVAVRDDRYGDTFPVPREHLGKRLTSMPITELAALAMVYFEALVSEAETLPE